MSTDLRIVYKTNLDQNALKEANNDNKQGRMLLDLRCTNDGV